MMVYIDDGFQKLTSIDDTLAVQLSKCQNEANILEWMTKKKTTLTEDYKNGPSSTNIDR